MRHWIRDTVNSAPPGASTWDKGFYASMWIYYHFLRTLGWTWVWECDELRYKLNSDTQIAHHCPDSNMEDTGTSFWTPSSEITLSKDTTTRHMLNRSLKIANARNGSSGTVVSDSFEHMENADFHCVFWYYNTTGNTYTAEVEGSSVNLTSGAGWQKADIAFTYSGTAVELTVTCPDVGGVSEDIYIDSINTFKSWFEYNYDAQDFSGSPDGELVASDEFSTASYTFTTGDIGKIVCVYDPTNEGNSGAWKIDAINGSNAVLDLRDGGSFAIVSQTGLRWRLIDPDNAIKLESTISNSSFSGWGLQSPHTNNWRLFMRPNYAAGPNTYMNVWSSPVDADFDVQTGEFSTNYPSSRDIYSPSYTLGDTSSYCISGDASARSDTNQRVWLITDDDGTNVQLISRGAFVAYCLVGCTGSDLYHSELESFVILAPVSGTSGTHDILFTVTTGSFHRYGGMMVENLNKMDGVVVGVLGYNQTSNEDQTNGKANPFNGEEYVRRPIMHRDVGGASGNYTLKELKDAGVRQCRPSYSDFTLVDADLYHLINGWCIPVPSGVTPL